VIPERIIFVSRGTSERHFLTRFLVSVTESLRPVGLRCVKSLSEPRFNTFPYLALRQSLNSQSYVAHSYSNVQIACDDGEMTHLLCRTDTHVGGLHSMRTGHRNVQLSHEATQQDTAGGKAATQLSIPSSGLSKVANARSSFFWVNMQRMVVIPCLDRLRSPTEA